MTAKKKHIRIGKKLDGTKKKSNAGRKPVITPVVLRKIEQAAAMDCSIGEILLYANISKDAYYDYLKLHPEFSARIEELRETPVLKARETVVKYSKTSYGNAMDYLKRKRQKEFGDRSEQTIKVPKPLLDALRKDE